MSFNIPIKLIRKNAQLPQRMSEHAAGYDIFSANEDNILLLPGERKLIPSGFCMAIPEGFEAQIRPRSGLALKYGITVLNTPGTIDADYRGEVGIILINLGTEDFIIEPRTRIAQMVIARHETPLCVSVEELPESTRGEGGFGSTAH